MRDCWSYQPSERPTFSALVKALDDVLTATAEEVKYIIVIYFAISASIADLTQTDNSDMAKYIYFILLLIQHY